MKPTRLLLASSLAIALVSCAHREQKPNYDTNNPYGSADGTQPSTAAHTPSQSAQAGNPTYDTPPAYEDSTGAPINPDAVVPPTPTAAGRAATAKPTRATTASSATHDATAAVATHGGTVYTVVANDNLTRISSKFKVPIASIKKANNMTNDTVVIGKKLVIPAH